MCRKFKDLTGRVIGRLTVIKRVKIDNGEYRWLCKCECGVEKLYYSSVLTQETTKSCGCLASEIRKSIHKTHGMFGTRLYSIFQSMLDRCYSDKHRAYKIYSSRGTIICKEWLEDRTKFFEWALTNGYKDNLTIDRIDNNGNYEPSNCRWCTYKEQSRNRSDNLIIDGVKLLKEYDKVNPGIKYNTIYNRIYRWGWSIEKALNTPLRGNRYAK
jgi:hypothetical protein